jgi:4-hydroxy-tetrahydrodipicolinate synthase
VDVAEPLLTCPSITPFSSDGALDEAELRSHLRRLVANGVGIYLASPGSGEGHALTIAETRRVYEIGVDECRHQVPVFANPREGRSAEEVYEIAKEAIAAGVDVVQLYQVDGGHGMVPNPREQEAYFRQLLGELDTPIALSMNAVAGYAASASLLATLCHDYPQIVAINLNHCPMRYVLEVRDAVPASITLYVAIADALQGMALGAGGVMSAESNVIPRTCRELLASYARGDMSRLSETVRYVQRFTNIVQRWSPSSARWLKMALRVLGLPGGNSTIRKPYLMPDESELAIMAEAFEHLSVRAFEAI